MTDTLGVHISESHITAVRFDAASADPPRVGVLGDSDVAAAAVVAQGEGGSVLGGDEAALITEGPRVTNPLQRAATGRIGALAAVLGFVIRRATAAEGSTPVRLAVIVDDDWQGVARDRIVQAGVSSGMADTIVVPRSVAAAQPTPVSGGAALAAGAARAGSLSSAHFVTREDLGQAITTKTPVVPVPDAPLPESAPVFGDESLVDPARVSIEQASSAGLSDFGSTRVLGSAGPPAATGGTATPPRSAISQALITLALVVLVGVVGGLIIFLAGDDSSNIATTGPTVTDAPSPVETPSPVEIEPPTTDAPEAAVSTTAPTSTRPDTTEAPDATTSSTTTTSPTTSTTTTTTPAAVGTPGPVTLVETGLQFDTGTVVRFGQPMESVLDEIRSVLGEPDSATNFKTTDACVDGARSVRWGQLELVFRQDPPVAIPADPDGEPTDGESTDGEFTDGDEGTEFIPASTGTFGQWYVSGYTDPTGLVTKDGLGVSATVGFLEVIYGSSLELIQPTDGKELGLFSIRNPASGGVINGTTSDVNPEGRVIGMWAGDTC